MTHSGRAPVLGVVFTQGVSVAEWKALGLLDREKSVYEELLRRGLLSRVLWFSYGKDDRKCESDLQGVEIVPMPGWLDSRPGRLLYSLLMPWIQSRRFKETDVLKTNQMKGSWTAVWAAKRHGKKLVVRTGFTWSMAARRTPLDWISSLAERFAYRAADSAVVSNSTQREYLLARYAIPPERLGVLPNYVDTRRFSPERGGTPREDRVVFVGRLRKQKNLENLLRALSGLAVGLDLYCSDDLLKPPLESLAAELGVRARFHKRVPNSDLPGILRSYPIFVLPSWYEGMPKALLEAMACGVCVLASDIPGTRELVEHGRTGWLVGTSPDDLRAGLERLLGDPRLRARLGAAAAKTVRENFSLEKIVMMESSLYEH